MPRPNQRVITLPKEIVDKIEAYIESHPDVFASIAHFIKSAVREKLEILEGKATYSTGSGPIDETLRQHPELGPVLRDARLKTILITDGERLRVIDIRTKKGAQLAAESLRLIAEGTSLAESLRLIEEGKLLKNVVVAPVSALEHLDRDKSKRKRGKG